MESKSTTFKTIDVEVDSTEKENTLRRMATDIVELKARISAMNRDKSDMTDKMMDLALESGSYKPIKCEVRVDWTAGEKTYINTETGAIEKVEPVTNAERQTELGFEVREGVPDTKEALKDI